VAAIVEPCDVLPVYATRYFSDWWPTSPWGQMRICSKLRIKPDGGNMVSDPGHRGLADVVESCAHTSVYTLRVKVPGNSHPWYKRRGQ
jgi:hypothetical protein